MRYNNEQSEKMLNSVNENLDILGMTQIYNSLVYLYNRINDIENSIEFCKLGTLHSSILPAKNLVSILSSNISVMSTDLEVISLLQKNNDVTANF